MKHTQFDYVKTLVENDIPTLLEGSAGCGKTTLAMNIASELDLKFYSMSMTKQTTVNAIIGFTSINGNYIGTEFRNAFEHGGLFLLDELDAGDANTLLVFNTIENGYMSFPDGVVHKHQDFRLIATANPSDQHSQYTGRSKLDAATLDRYEIVSILLDTDLEVALTSQESFEEIRIARQVVSDNNITKLISMRDAIRYHKRKELKLDAEPIKKLLKDDTQMMGSYSYKLSKLRPPPPPPLPKQSEMPTTEELYNLLLDEAGVGVQPGKQQDETGIEF